MRPCTCVHAAYTDIPAITMMHVNAIARPQCSQHGHASTATRRCLQVTLPDGSINIVLIDILPQVHHGRSFCHAQHALKVPHCYRHAMTHSRLSPQRCIDLQSATQVTDIGQLPLSNIMDIAQVLLHHALLFATCFITTGAQRKYGCHHTDLCRCDCRIMKRL